MRQCFLPGIALLAFAVASPAAAAERLVTVSGEATISVAPDTSIIRIGVTSQGKTAREASEANAKQMTAVLAAIKGAGIADKDVQTSRLSLQPQYDPNKAGAAHLTGFQVTNQVTVKIHDIDNLPNVLDRAIAAGANEMSGIEFVVSEQSKLLDQARDEAIADAHRKAEIYAARRRRQGRPRGRDQRRRRLRAAHRHAGDARGRGSGGAGRADAAGAGHRQLRIDAVDSNPSS